MTHTATYLDEAYAAAGCWARTEAALAPRAAVLMAQRLATSDSDAIPHHLDAEVAGMLAGHGAMLAAWIAARRGDRPMVVGLSGGQGSGKSTLAGLTATLLKREFGCRVAVLGLDDLYLPRTEREALARQVHPLFATRGVPGTHDAAFGRDLLLELTSGRGRVALPRFDKGADDRLPRTAWQEVEAPVDVVLFEGWCLGVQPEAPAALVSPCNDLERDEDGDGSWRTAVNEALRDSYQALFDGMSLLVYLRVPDFQAVMRWREAQEVELRTRSAGAMTPVAVRRFVAHYERLTLALRRQAPGVADLLIDLDEDHRLCAVKPGGGWRRRH